MNETLSDALAAILGLASALAGGFFAGRWQAAHEQKKEARLAIAELLKGLSAVTHIMCWLTWKAANRPQHVGTKDVDGYDDEIHTQFLGATGALAVVAALSPRAHGPLKSLTDEVYQLDVELATAALPIHHGAEGAGLALGALLPRCQSLGNRVVEVAVDLMAKA